MKMLLKIFNLLSVLALISICLFWFLYHGSGHTIPIKTDIYFLISILVIIIFIFIIKDKRRSIEK